MKQRSVCFNVISKYGLPTLVITMLVGILAPFAQAGTINGSIRQDNVPVRNIQILITCRGQTYFGKTNERGSYSINVEQRGRCTFALPGKQNASHSIASSNNPVRYDFILIQTNDGVILKRR